MRAHYMAYMLRLWTAGEGETVTWRASLEDPRTGDVHAFASVHALVAFLEQHARTTPSLFPSTDDDEAAVQHGSDSQKP